LRRGARLRRLHGNARLLSLRNNGSPRRRCQRLRLHRTRRRYALRRSRRWGPARQQAAARQLRDLLLVVSRLLWLLLLLAARDRTGRPWRRIGENIANLRLRLRRYRD
jgi:hypothetical protein